MCLQFTQKPVLPVSWRTDNPGDRKDGSLSISAIKPGPGMGTFDMHLQSLAVPAWGSHIDTGDDTPSHFLGYL